MPNFMGQPVLKELQEFAPTLSMPEVKRLAKEVLPFAWSAAKGDPDLKQAREVIQSLVVEQYKNPLTQIDKLRFFIACGLSSFRLPGYDTLDENHIKSIESLVKGIKTYAGDSSQKRPLVFLMLASPGAGKSHFVKCIAKQLRSLKVGAITYNMAGLQSNEDMIPPLDAVRNLKVEDSIPLLFLDEFDSSATNIPLLLPLLWDGDVTIGQRDLKLGKVIIILAGSDPSLPVTMEDARSMRAEVQVSQDGTPKMIDLLSRINGEVFSIPPFYDAGLSIDRRADKVCAAISLLRQRFGDQLRDVPLSLLRFVARAEFRYGVRSVAHLVSLIPHQVQITSLKVTDLELPINNAKKLKSSSLAYHLLHQDQAAGVQEIWTEASSNDTQMPIGGIEGDFRTTYPDDRFFRYRITRLLFSMPGDGTRGRKFGRKALGRSRLRKLRQARK